MRGNLFIFRFACVSRNGGPQRVGFLVFVHNYGGRHKRAYLTEFIRKLLVEFPAHVSVLQEHDPAILHEGDHRDFHVCLGLDERGHNTGLSVLGRKQHSKKGTSCIAAVNLLT